MEFLTYLSNESVEIVTLMRAKGISFAQNSSMCKKYKELFGVLQANTLAICLDNIKNTINPVFHYVNETLYHEAAHMAQQCNKNRLLGVDASDLSLEKRNDAKRSTKYNPSVFKHELEAYHLESRPSETLAFLRKHCS